MKVYSRQGWVSVAVGLLGMIVAVLVFIAGDLFESRMEERWRAQTVSELSGLHARLGGELNGATNLTAGLIAHVAVTGGIDPERFQLLARELMARRSLLRNITLAPDNVITMVYPKEGNEVALGLDLLNHPVQGAATRHMIATAQPVLAGPVELVQGGMALIHRVPIYLSPPGQPIGSGRYWGLMSTPIDFDRMILSAGLKDPGLRLNLALRGVDGRGREGAVFWGDPALFERPDAVELEIRVLEGSWVLAAVPFAGPPGVDAIRMWTRVLAVLCALSALMLAGYLFRTGRQLQSSEEQVRHLALHDSLTGLANRVLLDGRFRQAAGAARRDGHRLALLYLDLDNFKPINDQYGHDAGDRALCAIAARLNGFVRQSDTVARVGGDEFVILLGRVATADDAWAVAQKVALSLCEPMLVDGRSFVLGASIGIAVFPDHADSLNELMRVADHAMYRAKGGPEPRIALSET